MEAGNIFDDTFSKTVWELGKKFELNIYPVGGVVRDFFLGVKSKDYDFIILYSNKSELKNKVLPFLENFSESFNLKIVKPSRFETYRLVSSKISVDFSPVKTEELKENLLSRDLTINSIAFSFDRKEYIDPASGIEHIQKKILKVFSEENFKNDPLRILRLYRFYSQLNGFEIDTMTENFAIANAGMLKNVAKERVKEELSRVFSNDCGHKSVKRMFFPVLSTIFPSLEKIKNIAQNGYHHLNVVDHTLKVLEWCFDYRKIAEFFPFFKFDLTDTDKLVLRLSALFHDVGKADTLGYHTLGYTTFKNHQFVSGSKLLKDLDFFPKTIVERVYYIVRRHMLFLNFIVNGYTKKSFRKLINMMREDAVLLAMLFIADKNAARGPLSKGNFEKGVEIVKEFLMFYKEEKDKILNLPKLISGYEIIKILDIAPSKEVGKVLNLIMEKQIENPDFSREDALKLIYGLKKEREKKGEG